MAELRWPREAVPVIRRTAGGPRPSLRSPRPAPRYRPPSAHRPRRVRMRLRTQVLVLQCVVVAVALATAFGAFAYVSERQLVREYQLRALAVARTVASDPDVRRAPPPTRRPTTGRAAAPSTPVRTLAAGAVQARAEAARSARTRCSSWSPTTGASGSPTPTSPNWAGR
ncbi:hypothetical protein NKH77_49430 [Streptomyces sp. M19]